MNDQRSSNSSFNKQPSSGTLNRGPRAYGAIPEVDENRSAGQKSLNLDNGSEISATDKLPKVGSLASTINLVKAFLCLGILAAPYGFETVGFIPATVIIMIFGILNTYTVHLQQRIKRFYGNKVKAYTDMGFVCFGPLGHIAVVLTIIVNQVLTCTSYLLFFYEQVETVL